MPFDDYNEVETDPLVLPINGKKYTIPEVNIADGIRFTEVVEGDASKTMTDEEFFRTFLGSTYDEMLADNVPGGAVHRAASAALADFQSGRALAEIMWKTGGDPKGLQELVDSFIPPNRSARRASKPSTSTAAANTTKRPGSTSGTRKSPKS